MAKICGSEPLVSLLSASPAGLTGRFGDGELRRRPPERLRFFRPALSFRRRLRERLDAFFRRERLLFPRLPDELAMRFLPLRLLERLRLGLLFLLLPDRLRFLRLLELRAFFSFLSFFFASFSFAPFFCHTFHSCRLGR